MIMYDYNKLGKYCLGREYFIVKFFDRIPGSNFILNPSVIRDNSYTYSERCHLLAFASLRKLPEYKFFGETNVLRELVPKHWDLSHLEDNRLVIVGDESIILPTESKIN